MVAVGEDSPSLHLSNILDSSRGLLQSLQAEKAEDEPVKKEIKDDSSVSEKPDFEPLDPEFEKKSHSFANKFFKGKKSSKKTKKENKSHKQQENKNDPVKLLKNAL